MDKFDPCTGCCLFDAVNNECPASAHYKNCDYAYLVRVVEELYKALFEPNTYEEMVDGVQSILAAYETNRDFEEENNIENKN